MARSKVRLSKLAICCIVMALVVPPAPAAELSPETSAAFDHYVQLTEMRMDDELRDGQFVYIDRLPAERRAKLDAQLRRGEIYIEQLHTMENDRPVRVPNGAVHHWVGVAFLPHATVPETLHVIQDYERYAQVYRPDVRRSKILESDGDNSKFYLQIYKKSIVTVVLNANFDGSSRVLSSTRGESRSHSTRIVEVRNSGERDEEELAEGKDHGYLWRMDGYWKVEQKDGGVYLQFEIVALTGTISPLIAWLIRDISRSVMVNVLASTAKAVDSRRVFATDSGDSGVINR